MKVLSGAMCAMPLLILAVLGLIAAMFWFPFWLIIKNVRILFSQKGAEKIMDTLYFGSIGTLILNMGNVIALTGDESFALVLVILITSVFVRLQGESDV